MRDIAGDLLTWAAAGERFAVASVVHVRGSAPRGPGAAMAVREDGTVIGSLSGGCVEGSVYARALEALETGEAVRTEFDDDPDDPFAVGLTCGGRIEVYIHPLREPHRARGLLDALRAVVDGRRVALARVLGTGATLAVRPEDSPDAPQDGTGDRDLDRCITAEARAMLDQNLSGVREVCVPHPNTTGPATADGAGVEQHAVFVESWSTQPRMLVFGAIDHAAALTRMGKFLGYHVTVCDARAVFATTQRFPEADEVVVQWPHEYLAGAEIDQRTVICVLTHDAKFDVPVLREALHSGAAYVGALGSRGTHADRIRRLRASGVGAGELQRLRAPIGLDLGGRTPEETAVSIAAEIIAVRTWASTLPLTHTSGPLHAHA